MTHPKGGSPAPRDQSTDDFDIVAWRDGACDTTFYREAFPSALSALHAAWFSLRSAEFLIVRHAPRRLSAVLIHFQHQVSVPFRVDWIDANPASAMKGHSGHEIERPFVQRADERRPPEEAVREGTAPVGTFRLSREDTTVAPVKDSDADRPDLEGPAFAPRYARNRPESNVFDHGAHPTTGSECRN